MGEHGGGGWEGSAEGIAYSEFNHHFAGLFDVRFWPCGVRVCAAVPAALWIRLVLPSALSVIGALPVGLE